MRRRWERRLGLRGGGGEAQRSSRTSGAHRHNLVQDSEVALRGNELLLHEPGGAGMRARSINSVQKVFERAEMNADEMKAECGRHVCHQFGSTSFGNIVSRTRSSRTRARRKKKHESYEMLQNVTKCYRMLRNRVNMLQTVT